MSFFEDLKSKYARLDIVGKVIAIEVIAFALSYLLSWIYSPLYNQLMLPGDLFDAILQPWSFFTYGFLHASILHLLFNMLILYTAGRFILNLFNGRRFLTIFLVGILAGGLLFVLAHSLLPGFVKGEGGLIGASAGVYATLFFMCFYSPEMEVRLIFFNVKLKYIAWALLAINVGGVVLQVNTGGALAHLGGAFIGFYFATRLKQGVDVGEAFAKAGDATANLFKFNKKQSKRPKSRMKTVYKNPNKSKAQPVKRSRSTGSEKQKKIDTILDKISESGYDSLTKAEKDFLFKAGKE